MHCSQSRAHGQCPHLHGLTRTQIEIGIEVSGARTQAKEFSLMAKASHRTEIVVAIISSVGLIAVAVIANWEKVGSSASTDIPARGKKELDSPTIAKKEASETRSGIDGKISIRLKEIMQLKGELVPIIQMTRDDAGFQKKDEVVIIYGDDAKLRLRSGIDISSDGYVTPYGPWMREKGAREHPQLYFETGKNTEFSIRFPTLQSPEDVSGIFLRFYDGAYADGMSGDGHFKLFLAN